MTSGKVTAHEQNYLSRREEKRAWEHLAMEQTREIFIIWSDILHPHKIERKKVDASVCEGRR